MIEINKIYNMDCLEGMKYIDEESIDMILCDLPYGTTQCKWDSIIPLDLLWKQYKRIIKKNGAMVFTASQPFTSALIMSNIKIFKYCWVWEKTRATGHVHAKNKPLKIHEDICVFSKGTTVHASQSKNRMTYNPQGIVRVDRKSYRPSRGKGNYAICGLRPSHKQTIIQTHENYPKSIIKIKSEHNVGLLHPTQKPLELFEYLIKTYTNKGELVLDSCIGSGTTAIACINTNRNYIGFDNGKCDKTGRWWADIATERVNNHIAKIKI